MAKVSVFFLDTQCQYHTNIQASSQVVNLAIRSGISYAGKFAFSSLSKFLASVPDKNKTTSLGRIHQQLHTKIQIVTPAIDLIELMCVSSVCIFVTSRSRIPC